MTNFDKFSSELLEEARYFYQKGIKSTYASEKKACLHASLLLCYAAFESHINAIAKEFCGRSEFSILEQSILQEKQYKFNNGAFELTKTLKMYRLIERVEFIYHRLSGKCVDKSCPWWSELKQGIKLRNELTHPDDEIQIDEHAVKQSLEGALNALNEIYLAIYKRGYPSMGRGLESELVL